MSTVLTVLTTSRRQAPCLVGLCMTDGPFIPECMGGVIYDLFVCSDSVQLINIMKHFV